MGSTIVGIARRGTVMLAHRSRGFTLIELLVVIALIAVLAAIGMAVYAGAQTKARDARRRSDVQAIAGAFEGYNVTYGVYPATIYWADASYRKLYVNEEVPKDPKANADGTCKAGLQYCYTCVGCDGTAFKACAALEQDSSAFCKTNRQ